MGRYIITFGQQHTHRVNGTTFDKDSVAVIEAADYHQARDIAFDLFDARFGTSYIEDDFDRQNFIRHFPRGKFPAIFKPKEGHKDDPDQG